MANWKYYFNNPVMVDHKISIALWKDFINSPDFYKNYLSQTTDVLK